MIQKLYANFSQGAGLTGIAERTRGQEFFASDDRGVETFVTFASQTSSEGCDPESNSQTVHLIQFVKL